MSQRDQQPISDAERGKPTESRDAPARKQMSPAAERALAEAAARRAAADQSAVEKPKEVQGHKGLDPARYGDWENKGIASDF